MPQSHLRKGNAALPSLQACELFVVVEDHLLFDFLESTYVFMLVYRWNIVQNILIGMRFRKHKLMIFSFGSWVGSCIGLWVLRCLLLLPLHLSWIDDEQGVVTDQHSQGSLSLVDDVVEAFMISEERLIQIKQLDNLLSWSVCTANNLDVRYLCIPIHLPDSSLLLFRVSLAVDSLISTIILNDIY